MVGKGGGKRYFVPEKNLEKFMKMFNDNKLTLKALRVSRSRANRKSFSVKRTEKSMPRYS